MLAERNSSHLPLQGHDLNISAVTVVAFEVDTCTVFLFLLKLFNAQLNKSNAQLSKTLNWAYT